MKEAKQKKFVLTKLKEQGFITRNQCLENYLSRLGAYMNEFKRQGLKFEAKYIKRGEGKDYIYILEPKQKTLLRSLTNKLR
jgi:biotin-(acetyl-CoA carboxylase) ligase